MKLFRSKKGTENLKRVNLSQWKDNAADKVKIVNKFIKFLSSKLQFSGLLFK